MKSGFLPFEIHITGKTDDIHKLSFVNTISIELLRPDLSVMRVEHMTNHEVKMSYPDAFVYCYGLQAILRDAGCKLIRTKIETAPFSEMFDRALYAECHFKASSDELKKYPLSRNLKTGKLLGTAKEYKRESFEEFIKKWEGVTEEIELCIFDSNKESDNDWMELYN